jgi:hypothetical protein
MARLPRCPLSFGILVLLMTCGAARAASAADNVRVLASQAAIRLNADPGSLTIATVPAGTILEVNAVQGDWYAVWLPADSPTGTRRLGFLARSDAELLSPPSPPPQSAPVQSSSPQPSRPPVAVSSQSTGGKGDIDVFGGVTFKLSGARALVANNFGVVADSGERTTLPTFGLAVGAWFGERRIFGVYGDFSGVDGGSAFAQIGSSRSEVTSALIDFHGGFQIQAPGRIRPYGAIGVGIAVIRNTGSLTLNGVQVSSLDQTQTLLSVVIGGGVRVMVSDHFGIKAGIDGLGVAQANDTSGERDYGRFTGGLVYSFN